MLAQENAPSPITRNKGRTKKFELTNKKAFCTPYKNKKKQVPELSKKLLVHVDLHFLKESNGDGDSLLVLLNQP
jgi:hypothetical protein